MGRTQAPGKQGPETAWFHVPKARLAPRASTPDTRQMKGVSHGHSSGISREQEIQENVYQSTVGVTDATALAEKNSW